jgi:hypothetical protein
MHLWILVGFAAGCYALLWLVQTLALVAVGEGRCIALPLRHGSSSLVVRWSLKLALHGGLLAILFLYPAAIGENPFDYYLARMSPACWASFFRTLACAIVLMGLLLAFNVWEGWVKISPRYPRKTVIYKVTRSFFIPLPLTLVEEALFRGLILEQLLRAQPAIGRGQILAILLGALIFASAHFVRRQKRTVLPAIGLFGLGVILGIAYVHGGHTLWLPVAIHAGGVWMVQVMRPFVEYRGPAWLIGYSSYPICGLLGLTAMATLAVLVVAGVVA